MTKIRLFLSAFVLALPASAYASLEIYKVPGPDLSNTIQAQTFVLQLGDTPNESGCVTWNGSADVLGGAACIGGGFTGGDEKSQSQTRVAGLVGIENGADLRVMFDANEVGTGGTGDPVDLENVRLLVLNPNNGNLIFSADLKTPDCTAAGGVPGVITTGGQCTIDPTLSGNGKNDALLRLDAAQAAAFDAAVAASGVALANVRIGLLANISGTASGFEGFYVGDISRLDPPVPEPGTLAVVALGLACTMFARRRWAPMARAAY